jgi:AAA15 family ATPase/GTPase
MLKQLELHNFKSHRHTQFNFDDSRLQAIVGQNSSGKTSVLQSLSYLRDLLTVKSDALEDHKNSASIGNNSATIGEDNVCIAVGGIKEIENNEEWRFTCKLQKSENDYWGIDRIFNINGNEKKEDYFSPDDYFYSTIGNMQRISRSSEPLLLPDFEFLIYTKLLADNLSKADYSEKIVPEVQSDGSGLAPTLDYLRSEDPDRL